ncbi:ATP-binding cassette domain-containing protein [Thalassolituus sp. LLYu03]|uniref:ATP-binding cassette domain-containing protein n=1 Tax=Thalassolituus sp. LLYu03 TaxID=3421656 RepID=UPI003D2B7B88
MSQTPDILLEARQLNLTRRHKTVLSDISLKLERGRIMTLIGPNGCGKSTLIKVLLGLEQADSGEVIRARGLHIGYMPQKLSLDQRMPLTVEGFLRLARNASRHDIAHWLQRLGIEALAPLSVHDLSGGEWQRVLLVRALLMKPDVLVLDEPVQGVDVQGQMELYRLIPQLRSELNCAVLMVSHDLHLVMAATDEVVCLNGHVCCSGHPDQVSISPAYLQLFGARPARNSAIAHYTHHHDHAHCNHDHTHTGGQNG